MRINKYLALHLNTSRRNADELIKAKKITVNNKLAVIGQDIMTTDVITYQNKILSSKIVYKYFKFYKPIGYVCSTKAQGKSKTIYDIVDNSLKYSGRLDKDSEGLMLLSNDGDWLNNINHPSKGYEKEYIVTVSQPIVLNSFKRVVTDKNEKLVIKKLSKLIPMNRMAKINELNKAMFFLISDDSSYVTGHSLVVDGGRTAW